jgi:hypothetical protein
MTQAEYQQYLMSLGIDPSLFRNFGANEITAERMTGYAPTMGDYGQGDPMYQNIGLSGLQSLYNQYGGNLAMMPQTRLNAAGQFSSNDNNYGMDFDPTTGTFALKVKSGDKEAASVPYKMVDGQWVPDWEAAKAVGWDTNRAVKEDLRGLGTVLGAAAGSYFLGPASAGGEVGTGTTGSAAIPGMNASGGWGYTGGMNSLLPGMNAGGGWGLTGGMEMLPGTEAALGASPYTMAGDGLKLGGTAAGSGMTAGGLGGAGGSVGGAASQMPSWLGTAGKAAGALGSLFGGGGSGSGAGSGLGGLLGAGLGYLDAKSQPDSLTIKNEIDPRLAQYAYGANGTGGIAGAASNLMNQQLNGPNPLADAGKQISGMANTLPGYNEAVANNKGLWDSNPWVNQQQSAITNKMTQNLLQNVMPNIGSQANAAGGYGGSRQGIAQGLAMSNMNTDLAPALSQLASSAWENSQNRTLQGANTQLNYGLQNQLQQAGLLGTGADLQQKGAWAPIQNATNVMGALPGNTSRTEPLFSNPWAGAWGGASLGSQVGGGTDWGGLFKGISGLFGGSSGNTPPVQNDFWNSSNLYPWLKG